MWADLELKTSDLVGKGLADALIDQLLD